MPPSFETFAPEQWTLPLLAALTCVWFFAVGTAFGSFLNVVVYRMPRGLPVGGASSHCPGCRRAIPWRDNVPILGYFRLKGRCQCRARPISARYPIVETIVGLVVLALLSAELLSGGANLPLRELDGRTGVVWVIWSLRWDLIGTYLYHVTLLYVLFGLALIELDGFRPPWGWLGFGLAVGLIAPAAAPFLHSVPLGGGIPGPARDPSVLEALVRSAAGLGAGIVLGGLVAMPWARERRRPFAPAHLLAATALAGTYLGWQAAFSVALASAAGLLILRRAAADEPALAEVPPSLVVWGAVLGQILLWRFLTRHAPLWPGPASGLPALIAAGAVLVATVWTSSRIPLPRRAEASATPPSTSTPEVVTIEPLPSDAALRP